VLDYSLTISLYLKGNVVNKDFLILVNVFRCEFLVKKDIYLNKKEIVLLQNSFQTKRDRSEKSMALLLDPDDVDFSTLRDLVAISEQAGISLFLVGGSLIVSNEFEKLIFEIKKLTDIPVIIFPGNSDHISDKANGILLLSMISGRNPDLLIGKHVQAAPSLKRSGLEILPTGYILIDGGAPTTVSYMSNTMPIPSNKPSIVSCTALAGTQLGLKNIYLDAGSGAQKAISSEIIAAVSSVIDVPLWVGGGIRDADQVYQAFEHGADFVVVGNAVEENPGCIIDLAYPLKEFQSSF
jgi:phosphoglycerol geranylgeranyltransferase